MIRKIKSLTMICLMHFSLSGFGQIINNDSLINAATSVSHIDSVVNIIQDLQDFGTRFMISDTRHDVVEYLENRFHVAGIDSVRIDSFACHTVHQSGLDTVTMQYNVIGVIPGSDLAEEVVIVGAHYDSFAADADPMISAPGADDNGSGVAVCLEAARMLSHINYQPHRTIEFICFAGEEFMLSGTSGSEHYAAEAAAAGKDIKLMINNDMVGYDDGNWTIGLSNYPECAEEKVMMEQVINNYTSLNVYFWSSSYPPFADVEPFMDNEYKAVYIEEAFFNPNYHTTADVISNMSVNYCTEVSNISTAALLFQDLTIGTEDLELEEKENIKLFPNPVYKALTIASENNETFSYTITNVLGHIVQQGSGRFNQELQVPELSKGIYIIQLFNDQQNFSKTFIKN